MEILTSDEFGRVQIPEKIREQLGLKGKTQLALEIQDSKLILKPLPQEPEVYYEGKVLVVKAEPIGDTETIIGDLRSQRITDLASW